MFGITNNNTQIAISGIDSFEFDSDDVTVVWDEKANKDTTGNIQNYTQTNFRWERSLKIFPSGATRAEAANVAHEVLTAGVSSVISLYTVLISNYKVPEFNGTWRVKSGAKVNLKMDDNATIDLSLEKFVNANQNAQMTGIPIVG